MIFNPPASLQVNIPCSVSDHITEPLGLASIALAIVVPLILGPLAATFLHIGLSLIGFVKR